MKKFIVYSGIDEASKVFIDPVIFSSILLKLGNTITRKGEYRRVLEELVMYSMQAVKKNNIVYAKLSSIDNKWSMRVLSYGEYVIGCIYESIDIRQPVVGSLATEQLTHTFIAENPTVKLRAGEIPLDQIADQLKKHVEKCISEKKKSVPPYYWIGKIVYNLKIEKLITDKGAYMYVLEGRDIFGRKYAVKVPREKSTDGKPLAIGGSVEVLTEIMRGLLNSLEVALSNKESIKEELIRRGYSDVIADHLLKYRDYILRPRAIVLLRDLYSDEEYEEIPPIIIEEYADRGDLERRIKAKCFDSREIAYIGIRIAGALALAHVNRFIHMDVKPQNILLVSCEREAYGYKPLLTDFVGVHHLFGQSIELKKATPEYADPLALLRGMVNYSYDLYSLGNTLYYAYTGKKISSRILLNLVILKKYYGLPSPLKVFLVDHPDLVPIAHKLEALFSQYNRKKTGFSQLVSMIEAIVVDADRRYLKELQTLPERLYSLINRLVELDEEKRYPDAIALWVDFVKTLHEIGYTNLIPHKPF